MTAEKREENIQDVPISINAFTGDTLKALGITNSYDLNKVVPGLESTESVGYSVIFLRGVGTDAFLEADPSIATYIDHVYLPFSMAADQKFGKVKRIEVLKGPQGTLFGRNAVGGAINIITEDPQFDKPEGELDVGYGSYDHRSAKVYASLPLTHNLAVSVSALEDTRDSYYRTGVDGISTSDPNGHPVPGEKFTGERAQIRYAPTDWFEVNLHASTVRDRGVSGLYSPNTDPSPLGLLLGIRAQNGFNNTATNENPTLGVLNNIYAGNLKFHFNWFDVKMFGSNQRVRADNFIDFDGSPVQLVAFSIRNESANLYTGELQIVSNATSWDADKLKWVAGAYYFGGVQAIRPCTLTVASTNLEEDRIFGVNVDPALLDPLKSSALAPAIPSGGVIFNAVLGTTSYSGYFQATYSFTDWLSLTLGGRLQSETRSIVDSRSFTESFNQGQIGTYGALLFSSNNKALYPDITTNRFSPKISLQFQPNRNLLAYASFQKASKSGTYNAVNIIAHATPINAEAISAYEVGLKSTWLDGLLTANASAFYYDQHNVQVQFVSLLAGGAIQFQNAPASKIEGADVDFTASLFPDYFNGLVLTLSGEYLRAIFTDYPDCNGFDEATGLYSGTNDCTGHKITRAPRLTGRVGLNKIFTIDDDSNVEIAGSFYYNSGYYTAATNVPASYQPKYILVDAHAAYSYEPYHLKITASAQNITNQLYSFSKLDNDFGTLTALAPPRTFGVDVSIGF